METSEDSPLGSAAVVDTGVRKWRPKDIVAVAELFFGAKSKSRLARYANY